MERNDWSRDETDPVQSSTGPNRPAHVSQVAAACTADPSPPATYPGGCRAGWHALARHAHHENETPPRVAPPSPAPTGPDRSSPSIHPSIHPQLPSCLPLPSSTGISFSSTAKLAGFDRLLPSWTIDHAQIIRFLPFHGCRSSGHACCTLLPVVGWTRRVAAVAEEAYAHARTGSFGWEKGGWIGSGQEAGAARRGDEHMRRARLAAGRGLQLQRLLCTLY